eukprot:SAG31_NODE_12646_length_927_cov_1.336957_2_plen_240_part_01
MEADNLLAFRANFSQEGERNLLAIRQLLRPGSVLFPEPLEVLPAALHLGGKVAATRAVLVQSFQAGDSVSSWLKRPLTSTQHTLHGLAEADASALAQNGVPQHMTLEAEYRRQLADIGVKAFFQMVLVDNFVHADLHPGNILVHSMDASVQSSTDVVKSHIHHKNAKSDAPAGLGLTLLDAGLVVSLSPQDRENFVDLFAAVLRGQGERAGQLMLERAPAPKSNLRNDSNRGLARFHRTE